MDVVVVMDGPETVNPETDTSFALMLSAQQVARVAEGPLPAQPQALDLLGERTFQPRTPPLSQTKAEGVGTSRGAKRLAPGR